MKYFLTRSSFRSFVFFLVFFFTSCSIFTNGMKPDESLQTISGQILVKEGNCMPSPNAPPCKSIGKKGAVLITSLSKSYDEVLLIANITSDEQGFFTGKIAPGDYSVFVDYKNNIHCSFTICDSACYCNPIHITATPMDSLMLLVDLAVH